MFKKAFSFGLIGALLVNPFAGLANHESETAITKPPESPNVMTIKSLQWEDDLMQDSENQLLKLKADFHYEGDFITLGQDFNYTVSCQVRPMKKRGGTKTLYQETRNLEILDDMEIEGPHDFSVTFVFTFYPHEFAHAKKRGVICNLTNATGKGGYGYVRLVYPPNTRTYDIRLKPKDSGWVHY